MTGLILVFAAITGAAFVPLFLRSGASQPYIAGVATLACAWATVPLWGVRPQIISLLLASVWLLVLERADARPKLLLWTIPLTVLWVNLHAGFALGLAISLAFLIGDAADHGMGRQSMARQRQPGTHLRFATLILGLDLLVVPLNPNGVKMFSYPFQTLGSAAMQQYIAEWAPPNFHRAEYFPFLLIVLITFAALAWTRQSLRLRELILLLSSLYVALHSIRMIPFFVLIAVPLITRRLGAWPRRQAGSTAAAKLSNAIILVAMMAFVVTRCVQVVRDQPRAEAQAFPMRAVEYLQAHPLDRIFNHYDWGGYLIWRLYPSTRVFIDGRADIYGKEVFDSFAQAYQLREGWEETLRRWNIHTILVPSDSALAGGLRLSPSWIVRYEDRQAVVYTVAEHASGAAPVAH